MESAWVQVSGGVHTQSPELLLGQLSSTPWAHGSQGQGHKRQKLTTGLCFFLTTCKPFPNGLMSGEWVVPFTSVQICSLLCQGLCSKEKALGYSRWRKYELSLLSHPSAIWMGKRGQQQCFVIIQHNAWT